MQSRNSSSDILAVNNFREYLRIPTVHPDINFDECLAFLQRQAKSLDLLYQVYHYFPKKPVVVMTWIGQEPTLPTILLNGHMDVVPVYEEKWTYPPFGAEMDDQKNIYARGAQDMKCVSILYLETIRRLKSNGVVLKRTIHISFMPDEETGGKEGMAAFVNSDDFKNLNVGFALDEGAYTIQDDFFVIYGERSSWKVHFHCPGQSGHGSFLLDNTPGEKVQYLLNQLYQFRAQEVQKLRDDPSLTIADVTTVNVTRLFGGIQSNVIPDELSFIFDCRLPVTVDFDEWEKTLNRWGKEAGEGVWVEFEQKEPKYPSTKLDDSNPYWIAFKKTIDKLNLPLRPTMFPAGTDMRYIRNLEIPALGFTPINNTETLAHGHDEYLNQDVFLKGIDIYSEIIPAVANA